MRINIDINKDLLAHAMEAGGFKTQREAVEAGLRLVSRRKVYGGLLALRGKLKWDDSALQLSESKAAAPKTTSRTRGKAT